MFGLNHRKTINILFKKFISLPIFFLLQTFLNFTFYLYVNARKKNYCTKLRFLNYFSSQIVAGKLKTLLQFCSNFKFFALIYLCVINNNIDYKFNCRFFILFKENNLKYNRTINATHIFNSCNTYKISYVSNYIYEV